MIMRIPLLTATLLLSLSACVYPPPPAYVAAPPAYQTPAPAGNPAPAPVYSYPYAYAYPYPYYAYGPAYYGGPFIGFDFVFGGHRHFR
ncbi:MAG TPA: hypothetical protein VKT70_07200 [Stellaceae bacterium]|nr:hypothetical protein [Stellaceae bacterium]